MTACHNKEVIMVNKKSAVENEKKREDSIVEEWARIFKDYRFSGLNEQEKAQFERAQFAQEQGKKTHFVLGEPIKH